MDKRVVFFIVKRYLRFDKDQPFIFLSAFLAFLGITVGVMVLIIAMAIMNGFDNEFEKKLFTMNYPLTIYPKFSRTLDNSVLKKLESTFPNLLFSPYISTQAIVKSGDSLEGAMVFGVDFKREKKINDILRKSIKGVKINRFDAIVGKEMFDRLFLVKNQKVMFIFTRANPNGFIISPLMKRFKIKGYFRSGLIAYDKTYVYTTLESLRRVLGLKKDEYNGIHIYSKNAEEDIKKIAKILPSNVGIVGWWQQNQNFFSALAMEKRALFIVLMLIILIAALNIISSLLMTVMNRRKEIALLLSLGATKKEINYIFFYIGSIIGFFGIICGVILGFLGLYILGNFDIIKLPADVYGTSKLPLDLSMLDFSLIIVGTIFIIILSSLYPAKKATQIDVIKVLRNE